MTGGATAGYMDFVGMVQTSGVAFSIPYNYELVLKSGKYSFDYPYKLMPGASLTVDAGATLDLNSEFYVYDGLVQSAMSKKSYPTADALKAENAHYSTNANFIVNGTLNINQGATFLGVIQTTNTKTGDGAAKIVVAQSGDEKEGKKVTLSGKIVDGGSTIYDCNYAEYDSTARIWIKTGDGEGTLYDLVAGKTYVSTYQANDATWGFEGASTNYEESNDTPHTQENVHLKLTTTTLTSVSDLTGSWMVEHGEAHEYDWTPNEDEKPSAKEPWKTLTRRCTVLGCDHEETKYLLYKFGEITSQEYRGSAFTTADITSYFKAMYEKLPEDVTVTCALTETATGAKDYQVTVTLKNAWFLGEEDAREDSATFTFTITRKAIEVTINDQSAEYSAEEPEVKQGKGEGEGYTVEGLIGSDTLGITIEKAEGVNVGTYDLTAKEAEGSQYANGNYTINFKYSDENDAQKKHSVFTINKATLTVTPNAVTSPEDEEPIPTAQFTATITGFKGNDEATLKADILSKLTFSCEVTKSSPKGDYEITVTFGGTLDNYDVDCSAKGTYTVTDPLFKNVKFEKTDFTVPYDGNAHSANVVGTDGLTEATVTVTYSKGGQDVAAANVKDFGTYNVSATITAKGENGQTYSQTIQTTLTIEKLDVHVTLLSQEKEYDGKPADVSSAQGKGWKFTTADFTLCGNDEIPVLGIALTLSEEDAQNVNAGTYTVVTSRNENGNYNVIFDNARENKLYKINAKRIDVTVTSMETTYGDGISLNPNGYTFDKSRLVGDDKISVTLTTDAVDVVRTQPYSITGTAPEHSEQNDNYDIHITNGTWTVKPKAITIVIAPKQATYSGSEPAAPTAWALKAGSALVNGDDNGKLNVRLTKEPGTDAGSYDITGAWNNNNYKVTFEGEEDAYTINKKDISATGDFIIMAGDESLTGNVSRVTFAGTPLQFTGSVLLDGTELPVTLTFSPDKITEIGEVELTVTVNGTNYSGSKSYRVIVTNADGYTKRLTETIDALKELAEGMTAETLTAEDFGTLKQMKALLDALDEDEKETGATALAPYEALISAWDEAVDGLDGKIGTAQSIGDALLGGLFGTAAALSALAAVAYVIGKGGIL